MKAIKMEKDSSPSEKLDYISTSKSKKYGYFTKLIEERTTSCLSILASQGNIIGCDFLAGSLIFGDAQKAVNSQIRFNIGSVTKPVTASLLIKLLEFGEITLDDSIRKFVPKYLFENIKICHLLTHTAGYREGITICLPKNKEDKERYLGDIYSISSLTNSPGEISTYFTWGYSILMDIIEKVTGVTLEEFAQEVLFKPLGMNHTTYEPASLNNCELVLPYNAAESRFLTELRNSPPTGDSGLYTTAEDLIKFGQMLLNGGGFENKIIFARATTDFMLREISGNKYMKTPIFWVKGSGDKYGCFGELCSSSTVGHPGFSGCMLFIDPENKVVGVILSNSLALHLDWKNYKKISNVIMSRFSRS